MYIGLEHLLCHKAMAVGTERCILLEWLLLVLFFCLKVNGNSPKSITVKEEGVCPGEFSLKHFSVINVYYYGTSSMFHSGFLCELRIEEGDKADPNVVGPNPKICVSVKSFVDKDCSVAVELYDFEPEYSFGGPDKKYSCFSNEDELEEEYCTHMHKLYIQIKDQKSDVQNNVTLRVFSEPVVSTWEPPEDDEWKKWTIVGSLLGAFCIFSLAVVVWYCCLRDWCQSNHRHSYNGNHGNNQVPQEVLEAYPMGTQFGTSMPAESQAQQTFRGFGTAPVQGMDYKAP